MPGTTGTPVRTLPAAIAEASDEAEAADSDVDAESVGM
jgi:hypothetical protein